MLTAENTLLMIIDVQGKLARIVQNSETVIKNINALIRASDLLDIPIITVEQNPEKLGPTVPEISESIIDFTPVPKMSFSAFKVDEIRKTLKKSEKNNILLVGVETHVCVYQTAMDLLQNGYHVVYLVSDAVSSRTSENKKLGIEMMKEAGAKITGTETVLFEMLETCENEYFRSVLALIK